MRALIYIVIGAILLAAGIWWIIAAGHSIAAIVAMMVTATGGAILVAGISVALDMYAPTSKKL